MLTFYIKKVVAALATPLSAIILLLIMSVFFQLRGKKKRALITQTTALLLLIATSTPFLPNQMLPSLERQYPQFDIGRDVEAVVVLGCGHSNDSQLSITSQLYSCSLYRVTEGVRIWQQHPSAQLIFTGYGANEPFSNAEMGQELAVALGVPQSKVFYEPTPKDTYEESIVLRQRLRDKTFALVTSASHMPRAIRYFEAQGLTPSPAPTGHLFKDESRDSWWKKLPTASNLRKSETIIYEHLALLKQKLE